MHKKREWDTERDGDVRFRGPVKSVALCFMKRVEKDIKSQHFPPGKGISQHTHTLALNPPASHYKAEWRGGMAAFVSVCQRVRVSGLRRTLSLTQRCQNCSNVAVTTSTSETQDDILNLT